MQTKNWILRLGVGLLLTTGCGRPENKVTFPENPEPMPPEDVQLQQDASALQQTFDSRGGQPPRPK